MYKYVFEKDFDIDPLVREMPKHEVIEHTAHFTHNKFDYSNGWALETKVHPGKIEIWSNVELSQNSDGKYFPKL